MAKSKSKPKSAPAPATSRSGAVIKLQIAGAVFVPMLALGLWLTSKGFFG
jgi:hypothetical protein